MANVELQFHKVTKLPAESKARQFRGHIFFNDATAEPLVIYKAGEAAVKKYESGIYLCEVNPNGQAVYIPYNGATGGNNPNAGIDIDSVKDQITLWAQKVEGDIKKYAQLVIDADKIMSEIYKLQHTDDGILEQISTIKQTCNSIAMSVKSLKDDVDQNWSTFTQTDRSFELAVADISDRLSQLIIDLEGIRTRVEDGDGNYTALSQKIDEIKAEVVAKINGLVADMAALKITPDTIEGEVKKYVEGIVSEKSLRTQMAGLIKDEVKKYQYALDENGDIMLDDNGKPILLKEYYSTHEQTATAIKAYVGEKDADGNLVNYSTHEQTATAIKAYVGEKDADGNLVNYSTHEQTATAIKAEVTNSETKMSSLIEQKANEISLKVEGLEESSTGASIIAKINDNNDSEIKIKADKIELDGEAIAKTLTVGTGKTAIGELIKSSITDELGTKFDDLQNQIDGVIDNHYGEDYPVSSINSSTPVDDVEPYSLWLTADTADPSTVTTERDKHVGDTYTNISKDTGDERSGRTWRFVKDGSGASAKYTWYLLDDNTSAALNRALEALGLSQSKRRVFTGTPTTPYDEGDLWVKLDDAKTKIEKICVCVNSRPTGSYDIKDWVTQSDYVTTLQLDTVSGTAKQALAELSDTIKKSDMDKILIDKGFIQTKDGKFTSKLTGVESSSDINGITTYTIRDGDKSYTWYSADSTDEKGKKYVTIGQPVGDSNSWFTFSEDGLLQADNAWIRGQVIATSGSFTGDIVANTLELRGSTQIPLSKITGLNERLSGIDKLIDTNKDNAKNYTDARYSNVNTLIDQLNSQFNTTKIEFSSALAALRKEVQQGDNGIEFHYVEEKPGIAKSDDSTTLVPSGDANDPSSAWTSGAARLEHVGDICVDENTGMSWKYIQSGQGTEAKDFVWKLTTGELAKTIKSLGDLANQVQGLEDNNLRVFTDHPRPPYSVGDIWIKDPNKFNSNSGALDDANGSVLMCIQEKEKTESYNSDDWTGLASASFVDNNTKYLKEALGSDTLIEGGLVLSSVIAVRSNNTIMSGMNASSSLDGIDGTVNSTIAFFAGSDEGRGGNTNNAIQKSNFIVYNNGSLYAKQAHIEGEITATSGSIGGIKINNNGVSSSDNNFSLSSNGVLKAKGATIEGEITATKLTINSDAKSTINELIGNYINDNNIGSSTSDSSVPSWLTDALSQSTIINGGLIFTSGIGVGYTNTNATYVTAGLWGLGKNGSLSMSSDSPTSFYAASLAEATKYSHVRFFAGVKTEMALNNDNKPNNPSTSDLDMTLKGKFLVLDDGSLYASAAKITGEITATTGRFGNLFINGEQIGVGSSNNPTSVDKVNSYFDDNGVLHAKGATIEGDVTAKKLVASSTTDGWTRSSLMDDDEFTISSTNTSANTTSSISIRIMDIDNDLLTEDDVPEDFKNLSEGLKQIPTLCMTYNGKEYIMYPGAWRSTYKDGDDTSSLGYNMSGLQLGLAKIGPWSDNYLTHNNNESLGNTYLDNNSNNTNATISGLFCMVPKTMVKSIDKSDKLYQVAYNYDAEDELKLSLLTSNGLDTLTNVDAFRAPAYSMAAECSSFVIGGSNATGRNITKDSCETVKKGLLDISRSENGGDRVYVLTKIPNGSLEENYVLRYPSSTIADNTGSGSVSTNKWSSLTDVSKFATSTTHQILKNNVPDDKILPLLMAITDVTVSNNWDGSSELADDVTIEIDTDVDKEDQIKSNISNNFGAIINKILFANASGATTYGQPQTGVDLVEKNITVEIYPQITQISLGRITGVSDKYFDSVLIKIRYTGRTQFRQSTSGVMKIGNYKVNMFDYTISYDIAAKIKDSDDKLHKLILDIVNNNNPNDNYKKSLIRSICTNLRSESKNSTVASNMKLEIEGFSTSSGPKEQIFHIHN